MEILINFVVSALSWLASWFITHTYYKKSLNAQTKETGKEISELLSLLRQQNEFDEKVLYQQRLEDAIAEYRRAGTPVRAIDTFDDMSKEQKAELYDIVMIRVKGRKGKSNKYRE